MINIQLKVSLGKIMGLGISQQEMGIGLHLQKYLMHPKEG